MTTTTAVLKQAETGQATFKTDYIESFDFLRGVAALLVLLHHASSGIFKGGWLGVNLFFVLSGYLITSLLKKEYSTLGDISFFKFYVRRALRLFPALIIGVIIALVLWPYTQLWTGADKSIAAASALFYFTNFIKGNVAGNLVHLWSLAVEEHFYLFWPLLSLFLMRGFPAYIRNLALFSLILFVAIFKIIVFNFPGPIEWGVFIVDSNRFTFCKMDGILMGAALAFNLPQLNTSGIKAPKWSKESVLILVLFAILFTLLLTLHEGNTLWRNGGFLFTNLSFILTVFLAIKHPTHHLFSNKFLQWFGRRSYGIYVYHFPIFLALGGLREHEDNNVTNFLLVTALRFGISIGVAALSFKYIEQPILKFKKRFDVKKTSMG
jgi:peptidoglycan/LPS O-acetylase OafA/YrhL